MINYMKNGGGGGGGREVKKKGGGGGNVNLTGLPTCLLFGKGSGYAREWKLLC